MRERLHKVPKLFFLVLIAFFTLIIPFPVICLGLPEKEQKVLDHNSSKPSIEKIDNETQKEIIFENPVAKGSYPDIALDRQGNIHIVYGREGRLFYKKFDISLGKWSDEIDPDIKIIAAESKGIERSDPDIVIDSQNRPHIFAGSEYAYLHNNTWIKMKIKANEYIRDTELAIDSKDNLYIVYRKGNQGGNIGISKFTPQIDDIWKVLTDPDLPLAGESNHIYPDIAISPVDDSLHITYRQGKPTGHAYRYSLDRGLTWNYTNLSTIEEESPHIIVDYNGTVYSTTGRGHLFKKTDDGWKMVVRILPAEKRENPELAVDRQNNIYCAKWGGQFNILRQDGVLGIKMIPSVTGMAIGFVEMAGGNNCVYAVWEEGKNLDSDLGSGTVDICVGKILFDGTVIFTY
ncbi:MAG: hypothetical protein SNJ71_01985 [Bacteroidales bacterium]